MSDKRLQWSDRQIAVCAGLDAIRILMGMPPENFAVREIIWLLRRMKREHGELLARAIREASR